MRVRALALVTVCVAVFAAPLPVPAVATSPGSVLSPSQGPVPAFGQAAIFGSPLGPSLGAPGTPCTGLGLPVALDSCGPNPVAPLPSLPGRTSGTELPGCGAGVFTACLSHGSGRGGAAARSDPKRRWSVTPTPAPTGALYARPYGAACPSPDDCWAVGWSSGGRSTRSFAEHWDGRSWAPVPTPRPRTSAAIVVYGLNAVTCVSRKSCWAVGTYFEGGGTYGALMEHWDGHRWSLAATPAPPKDRTDVPLGVSCVSSRACWAVGYRFRCSDSGCGLYSLAERWDGRAWTRASAPSPFESATSGQFNVPSSVSCVSASDCWAAGYGHDGARYRSLLLHWDGRRWSVASPSEDVAQGHALLGVSCASSSTCWAVGLTTSPGNQPVHPRPLIERWDGTRWIAATPAASTAVGDGELAGVSCASRSACAAVGYEAGAVSGTYQTLIERWGGASWRTTPSEGPRAPAGTLLDAVSCPAAGACATVGAYANAFEITQPVAANLSGRRWVTTLTKFTGRSDAALQSVACRAPSACWAVGYGGNRGVILRWSSRRWRLVPAANDPSASIEYLYGVACASRLDCWAVGTGLRSAGWDALVEHWDGTRWSGVETPRAPSAGGVDQYLTGVACPSRAECWAVGTRLVDDTIPQPLIERFDGRSWSIAVHAAPGQVDGYLADVTCSAAGDCWAVGGLSAGNGEQALIEHWDGTGWRQVTTTDDLTGSDYLNAVACRSASDCWAVGSQDVGGGNFQTLALRWNGSAWTRVASPDGAAGNGVLTGVACSSARCWAVGVSDQGRRRRTLLLTWNGRRWTTVTAPSPNGGATDDQLVDIACAAATPDCRAVGWWADRLRTHAFAASYTR